MACTSDRCSANDTLKRNHVDNNLFEGLDHALSLDNVAHSTIIRQYTVCLELRAQVFPQVYNSFLRSAFVAATSGALHKIEMSRVGE